LVFNCKRLERQSDKTFGLDRITWQNYKH
jgi:hypothetical protein